MTAGASRWPRAGSAFAGLGLGNATRAPRSPGGLLRLVSRGSRSRGGARPQKTGGRSACITRAQAELWCVGSVGGRTSPPSRHVLGTYARFQLSSNCSYSEQQPAVGLDLEPLPDSVALAKPWYSKRLRLRPALGEKSAPGSVRCRSRLERGLVTYCPPSGRSASSEKRWDGFPFFNEPHSSTFCDPKSRPIGTLQFSRPPSHSVRQSACRAVGTVGREFSALRHGDGGCLGLEAPTPRWRGNWAERLVI